MDASTSLRLFPLCLAQPRSLSSRQTLRPFPNHKPVGEQARGGSAPHRPLHKQRTLRVSCLSNRADAFALARFAGICFGVSGRSRLRRLASALRSMEPQPAQRPWPPKKALAISTGLIVGSRHLSRSTIRCKQAVRRAPATAIQDAPGGERAPPPRGKVRGRDRSVDHPHLRPRQVACSSPGSRDADEQRPCPPPESTCWTVIRAAAAESCWDPRGAGPPLPICRSRLPRRGRWRGSVLRADLDDAVQEVFVEVLPPRRAVEAAGAGRVPGFHAPSFTASSATWLDASSLGPRVRRARCRTSRRTRRACRDCSSAPGRGR